MRKTISLDFTMDWPEAFWMLCDILDIHKLVGSEEDLCIHNGMVCRKDKETGEYITVDDRADLFCALRNVLNALAPNLHFRSDHYITNWGDECPTNGDMIRRMSNRELADMFGAKALFACEHCGKSGDICDVTTDCEAAVLNWLQSEAETDEEGS